MKRRSAVKVTEKAPDAMIRGQEKVWSRKRSETGKEPKQVSGREVWSGGACFGV